jgi:hypothetical protein
MQKSILSNKKSASYVVAIAALLCLAGGAQAGVAISNSSAQFEISEHDNLLEIAISGKIDQQTRQDFEDIIRKNNLRAKIGSSNVTVALNSPGGSVTDAMAIGDTIRELGFSTIVWTTNQCNSACVLILASGVTRMISENATVGIHSPAFDEALFASLPQEKARALYNDMSIGVRRYLLHMGISDGLYLAMVSVPSDEIVKLSIAKAREYGLEGKDPSWHEWVRAKQIQRFGKRQYELEHSLGRVGTACLNAVGPKKCAVVLPQYARELANACPQIDEASYIPCIGSFERQTMLQYQK